MTLIVILDAMGLVILLVALGMVLGMARATLSVDVRVTLALLLAVLAFHSLERFLDWASITPALDPLMDQLRILEPVLLVFFLHVLAQRGIVAELDESKRRYRDLLNEVDAVVWEADPQTLNPTFVSRGVEKLLGVSPEAICGSTKVWEDCIHPEDRDRVLSTSLFHVNRGERHELEYRYIRSDGEMVWVRDYVTPIVDAGGRVANVHGVMVDITEQRRTGQRLEQISSAIERVTDAVFWIDPSGAFFDVNDTACRTLRRTREELLRMAVPDIDVVFDQAKWEETWQRVSAEGQIEVATRLIRGDGTEFDVEVFGTHQRQAGREFLCAVVRDVTERREAERQRETFGRLAARLSTTRDRDSAFEVIADEARKLFDHDYLGFSDLNRRKGELQVTHCEDTPEGAAEPVRMQVSHEAMSLRQPLGPIHSQPNLINRGVETSSAERSLRLRPVGCEGRRSASLMFAPIHWGEDLLGTLSVQSYTPNRYNENDLSVLTAFAAQCSGALQRLTVEDEQRSLHRLATALTGIHNRDELVSVLVRESRRAFDHDFFSLDFIEQHTQELRPIYCEDTPEGTSEPRPFPPLGTRRLSSESLTALYSRPRLYNREEETQMPAGVSFLRSGDTTRPSASLMFTPILWGDELIGNVSVQSYTPGHYRERDLRLLEAFAAHCSSALQRVRAEEERQSLHQLTIALTEVHDRDELIEVITQRARRMFHHDYLGLDFISRETGDLQQVFAEDTPVGASEPVRIDSGNLSGLPPEQRFEFYSRPHLINRDGEEAGSEPKLAPAGDVSRRSASLMFAPIRWTGDTIGTISVQSYTQQRYREGDLRLLETFAAQCAGTLQRVRAEEERREIEAQLQHAQKLESLGVMAGGIAHDFNNLLTGVLGNASLLSAEEISDPQMRESLQQIEAAAQRASELCQQMLAYSGRGQFEICPLDLSHLVREMANIISASISKSADLQLDLAEALPPVRADVAQMQQVAMNLITNASDALGERPGKIRIHTGTVHADAATLREMFLDATTKEGEMVLLEVEDTGSGMDEETVQRIFDPFFTTKFTGRGLGLAAVLGIVRGHRGAIDVKSAPGRGTSFRVLLPVCEETALSSSRETPIPVIPTSDGGHVLVVDDEETVRRFARRCLERVGYTVETVESGEQALEMCGEQCHDIDLVVLDLTMPGLSGIETLKRMQERRPEIPVILSSGYNQEEVSRLLGHTQVSAFLKKPYRPSDLLALVQRALAKPR